MAYLKELLKNVTFICTKGTLNCNVLHLTHDSKEVKPGSMFICLEGVRSDGHSYIGEAVQRGARVLLVSKNIFVREDVTVIRVRNTKEAMAYIARDFYGAPADSMMMIGITGTKGKTTTAYMLYRMCLAAGMKTGCIGTLGIMQGDEVFKRSSNTTPDALSLQKELREMADAGCECCIMEVSSQGLKHCRVSGISFAIGIFTNLSPDHIGAGEHRSFGEYAACKRMLFARSRLALVNADDNYASYMTAGCRGSVITYGIHKKCDCQAYDIEYQKDERGLAMTYATCGLTAETLRVTLPGIANIYNSLAAWTAGVLIGIPADIRKDVLAGIQVKGRIEEVKISSDFDVIIDYAHNAESLKTLLLTLRAFKPKRIISVFGCGGNRSLLRRFQMGETAGKLSDVTILTSDNPRYESPEKIISDIEEGMKKTNGRYHRIPDRREAIAYAITHALPGDMIVIAGKGHEEYQEINGQLYPMNERQMIESCIRGD